MPRELTERQQEIYDFIAFTIRDKGYPPTIREIMDQFNIASTNGVRTTLAALEKKGHIKRRPMLSRGIELTARIHRDISRCRPRTVRRGNRCSFRAAWGVILTFWSVPTGRCAKLSVPAVTAPAGG